MDLYGEVDVPHHPFLLLTLDGGASSFISRKRFGESRNPFSAVKYGI